MNIFQWIANNLFGVPAFFIGLIVALGLIFKKSSLSKVITGTLKAIMGFLIIDIGSGAIVGGLEVFQPLWSEVFGLAEGSMPTNFLGFDSFSAKFGSYIAVIMFFGFFVNVLIARFTRFKYIYLTGHMMFWTVAIFLGVIVDVNPNINMTIVVPVLSLIMGLYWTFQPALTQKYVVKATGNDKVALGHTVGIGGWLAGLLGNLVKGKEYKSAEDIKISDKFSFFRDSNVITALTMGGLFIIGGIILMIKDTPGAKEILANSGSQNFIIYSIVQAIRFSAGIAVVLYGVRLFISELVPAFKGFSDKLVPGAIPAIDVPFLYSYAPNSVIFGFLGAFIGGLIWMIILGNTAGYVFVPTMIVLFFHGAGAGVLGNTTGGWKGAILGGIIIATIVAVGQWICVMYLLPTTIPDTASWAADTDMFILGPVLRLLFGLIK
ncbi:PTS ascorbate transporter subunit IIC [Helcococcus kunzii]|uniref:PTS ascorbate transporter subunit IIC n=1 Tax=Helcococcus kunzii TaxID=40091 RepID=UPI001BAEEE3C|nr:PTS ascorbate transporter subunit IIC [Helcococcus kunzii]QUY64042.1 PTS ascorbate transporter subunit IIC [Helcococcus kunzii]